MSGCASHYDTDPATEGWTVGPWAGKVPRPRRQAARSGLSSRAKAGATLAFYFHGGGWMIGDIEAMGWPCRALANAALARWHQ
jgi:acetyl esterase/lipase